MFRKDDITRRHEQLLNSIGILCQCRPFRQGGSVALDPIRRLGLRLTDQPKLHVARNLRPAALLRIAEAAAARHVDDQALAGRDGLEALGLQLLARRQRQLSVAAGSAAVAAARRMFYPLEGGEDAERRALAVRDFPELAQPP